MQTTHLVKAAFGEAGAALIRAALFSRISQQVIGHGLNDYSIQPCAKGIPGVRMYLFIMMDKA